MNVEAVLAWFMLIDWSLSSGERDLLAIAAAIFACAAQIALFRKDREDEE